METLQDRKYQEREQIPYCGGYIEHDSCVEFRFMKSPWPFYVRKDAIEILGGLKAAYAMFSNILGKHCQTRNSSRLHPYRPVDLDLSQRNLQLGKRYWQYQSHRISGNMSYYGYGYWTEDKKFQFYNVKSEKLDGTPV